MDIRSELASLRSQPSTEKAEEADKKEQAQEEEEEIPPLGEWEVEANPAIDFKLVWTPSDISKTPFHPQFTHQIFGEYQRIKGYKGLKVDFFFGAGSLYPYISLHFSEKKQTQFKGAKADEEITPVVQLLAEKLSPRFPPTTNLDTFAKYLEEKEAKFKPVGEKVHSYKPTPKPSSSSSSTEPDSEFEIYAGDIMDPEIAAYHEKLQIFVMFYIDCASYIEPDPDWRIFFVFEKRESSDGTTQYGIAGYCTAHLFYHYPDSKRLRISQFVILPPYQRRGHGLQLLQSVYNYVMPRNIADVTVEDPSIEFGYLKDTFDLGTILKNGYFKAKPLKDKSEYPEIQKKLKINKQQIRRCHEIHVLMGLLASPSEEKKKEFRLAVKSRLNKKYLDMLIEAEPTARKQALADLYTETENDYMQVLSHFPPP